MSGSKTALISTDPPIDTLSLFNNSSNSDLILTIGTLNSQKLYFLHLHILDKFTPWFSSHTPRSPATAQIRSQKIVSILCDPQTTLSYEMCLRWIYGDKSQINNILDMQELIRYLYIARLWEVKGLQEVVVKTIMLKSYELKQLDRKIETNEEVWNAVEDVCQLLGMGNWCLLGDVIDVMALGTPVSKDWLVKLAGESKAGLVAALLLERHQRVLDLCLCKNCQKKKGKLGDQWEKRECLGCFDVLEVEGGHDVGDTGGQTAEGNGI
ncbi:hypothetical protein TWF173_005819 [Orbilia oligospora]|nr:hypothetical protein TWF173_005819 [Orbilia oligospora]